MKRILVLHTGGTIAMKEDTLTGGVSPDVSNPLMDAPIHIDDDVELIVEDIFNIPSPHMTPKEMLQLKERIQLAHLSGLLFRYHNRRSVTDRGDWRHALK